MLCRTEPPPNGRAQKLNDAINLRSPIMPFLTQVGMAPCIMYLCMWVCLEGERVFIATALESADEDE